MGSGARRGPVVGDWSTCGAREEGTVPTMWFAILALSTLSPWIQSEAAPAPPLQVGEWAVLDAVDRRGRRPVRPDAVFAAHLLEPGAPPPSPGQQLQGELGAASWKPSPADAGGGPADAAAYAWGRLEVPPGAGGVHLARLSGAWQLFVNGRPHVGDAYRYGFGGVPVELAEGSNEIAVTGARGGFSLEFVPAPGEVVIEAADLTVPDLVVGEAGELELGVCLHRTALAPLRGARVELTGALAGEVPLLPVGPLETRVVALTARPVDAKQVAAPGALECELVVRAADGRALARRELAVRVVEETASRLRSFRSSIDGSTQVWGEVPPARGESGDELPGLVLSLHGASVRPRNQIGAYASHPGLWIVAPTNRRPFGFDWQDWGRRDAYEVRDAFVARTPVSDTRRYLTGHSMGGHGTWHLAANDPDQWAVIAPSAGWRSFDTYGGRPEGALTEWWQRADAASHTEAAASNLRALPTFVLHGDADSTVAASEARAMVDLLEREGAADLRFHFEPGAGHWWDGDPAPGAACVQWPAMFAMFDEYALPSAVERELYGAIPAQLDFRTVDPAVDSEHHWIAITEVSTVGRPARLRAQCEPTEQVWMDVDGAMIQPRRPAVIETENVARFEVDAGLQRVERLTVDGELLAIGASGRLTLERGPSGWRSVEGDVPSGRRRPGRSGPFKNAFDNGFVLVRGTSGDAVETEALADLARYHATEWWYRANGRALLMTDEEFLARGDLAACNVILYGNSDTNSAWDQVLEQDRPIDVRRGGVRIDELFLRGADRAALFVQRRRGSDRALVGAFGVSGPQTARLLTTVAPFVSGVGVPDYLVLDAGALAQGDAATVVTGFWDHDWRFDPRQVVGL